MTDSRTEKADKALLQVVTSGVEIKDGESFRKGYLQALIDAEQVKARKEQKKNKVFTADTMKDFTYDNRKYNSNILNELVHFENGNVIFTDGKYLLQVKAEYPQNREGKNINRDGLEYDWCYPKYERVIPSLEQDYITQNELKGLILKADKLLTSKSMHNLYGTYFQIGDISFSGGIIRAISKVLYYFADANLYVNTQDKSKAIVLKTETMTGVFMPLSSTYTGGYNYVYSDGNFIRQK